MKIFYYLILFFLSCKICEAQILVPNGDFEQYSGCPSWISQIDSALFWVNPSTGPPSGGSPDYFNACATGFTNVPNCGYGYQQAHSGNAYAGIALWASTWTFREYIETPLVTPLIPGYCYYFQMYVSAANVYEYSTDDLGVYFSNVSLSGINNTQPLPFIPQIENQSGVFFDTLNWTLVSGNYTATGGENYLIIGNFKSDAATSIQVIDSNTIYNYAYVYIDDVSISKCKDTEIEEPYAGEKIKLYPNPLTDQLNISINNNESSEVIIYDIYSRIVLQEKFTNRILLNTGQLINGIYLYEVRNPGGETKTGKIVKQ